MSDLTSTHSYHSRRSALSYPTTGKSRCREPAALLRQPPAEAERVAWVEIGVASRPASVRTMALQPRRLLARAAAARGESRRTSLPGRGAHFSPHHMLGGGSRPPQHLHHMLGGGSWPRTPPRDSWSDPPGPCFYTSFRSIFEGKIILWSYMSFETGHILQDIGLSATISQLWGQNRLSGGYS